MKHNRTRGILAIACAAYLASLAACGGSSDTAQASAQDDTADVTWNTSTPLAVTSNDLVENGTASVAVTSAPAHGTAVVEGAKIRYTPAAGYFGADTLRYRLTVGDKTSDASLKIAVAARMTFSGTVRDAPLAGALVVATVGGVALPAVKADPDGNYQVTVTTTDPTAFIRLEASGADSQSSVVLSSLVGDARQAAAVATDTGTVNATALPAANVTHVSTAIAVLSERALGKPPASSADVSAALGQFTPEQTIDTATAIKLVADEGVPLPRGSADTLALVSDPTALKSFVTTQATQNTATFAQTQRAVLSDRQIAVAPPTPASGAADKTLLIVFGRGPAATAATHLTLKAGNVATVEDDSFRKAAWSTDGSEISVVYDTPAKSWSDIVDDGTGHFLSITVSENGLKLRQLGGSPGSGTATMTPIERVTWLEGPHVGSTTDAPDQWVASTLITGDRGFAPAEFSIGARWAGVMSTEFSPHGWAPTMQDTVRIIDATRLVFERSQEAAKWALVDGKFVITTESGVYTYARLFTGPRGEERWLMEKSVGGVRTWSYDGAAVKVQDGVSFTVAGLAARWENYFFADTAYKNYLDLSADGGVQAIDAAPDGEQMPPSPHGHWSLGSDGLVRINDYGTCDVGSTGCAPPQAHTWQLLATSGDRIYVMERKQLGGGGFDAYRINVYVASKG